MYCSSSIQGGELKLKTIQRKTLLIEYVHSAHKPSRLILPGTVADGAVT